MIVIEKAKALALKLRNPNKVLATIPTAKQINVRGTDLVVLPHRLDEVRVLANLGIRAPSPIEHYYNFPGRFKPYDHQRETAAFLTKIRRGFVLNEIGTGKTQSSLWAADYMIEIGMIKRVLIMSPLSTLERVWGDAIYTGFPNRDFVVLHGSAAKRRKMMTVDVDFYIINHDGFPIIADDANDFFDLVIVDEVAVYRNASTNRFKIFNKFLKKNPNTLLWLMTGTPTPNEPTDAWALAKLAESPNLPTSFTKFKDMVMRKVGQWRWIPREESVDVVKHILQPAVRYTRDECFDLPETIVQTRQAPLSKEQDALYKQMLKQFVADLQAEQRENGRITAVNEAVKAQKLLQIACGVVYDDEGNHIEIDYGPRLSAIKEVIEEAGEKIIIFVPLTGALRSLERELSKQWTVGVVNGEVSAKKRNVIFQDFQHAKDPHILIAHPGTMSHGLTLTSASTIIWAGPINSNEQYVQANGRVERIGKRTVSNVVHIESTELERKAYKRLQDKQTLQGILLDLIQLEIRGS